MRHEDAGADRVDRVVRRAIDAATPGTVDADRLVQQVDERVARRRRRRRDRRVAGMATVAVVLVGAALVAVDRPQVVDTSLRPTAEDDTEEVHAAPTTAMPRAVVELPGSGPRVEVVAADEQGAWFARGDAVGPGRDGPDTVVRVEADGSVGPPTEVRGVAALGAVDDRWLWLLVDERSDLPEGSWRLKRISLVDGRLEASFVLDLSGHALGIAVEDGMVVVRDGTTAVTVDHLGEVIARAVDGAAVAGAPALPRSMAIDGTQVIVTRP